MIAWIPNNNPSLVGLLADGTTVPIVSWPASGFDRSLGRIVTGELVPVVWDKDSGQVFMRGQVWPSLTAYRATFNG